MSSTPETPDPLEGFEFKFDIDPDYLQMAMTHKQIFDAHVNVGFNKEQAMEITLQAIDGFNQVRAATAVLTVIGEDDGDATN